MPGTKPPGGTGTDVLVMLPVPEDVAIAAPAVLVATSTSYAVWDKRSAWSYVQVAVGVTELTPVGDVSVTVGEGGAGVKADVDQLLQ
ncbi:MAG: hypothetical protein FWE94_07095 [Coriobacteriia bacterium]|nr:hypothetical protein [Coriobacteriia bacterium]